MSEHVRELTEHPGQGDRIAVVFPDEWIGTAPSVINAVQLLSNDGYEVDILTPLNEDFGSLPNFGARVRIFDFKHVPSRQRVNSLPLDSIRSGSRSVRKWSAGTSEIYRRIELRVLRVGFAIFALRKTLPYNYTNVIGFDRRGLVIATLIGLIKRTSVVFWSLEIETVATGGTWRKRVAKMLEIVCNGRAAFSITQDDLRAQVLARENRIDPSKIVLIPNAPLGPPHLTSEGYFHRKFALPQSTQVILHAGMISSGMLSFELAMQAANFRDDWVLVFHERRRRHRDDPEIEEIDAAGQGHVLLSLDPVPYEQLDEVIASAQVGVVLYRRELGPNWNYMAGASGKLAQYLKCGLPVVSIDMPGLSDVMREYKCGFTIQHISEFGDAVAKILEDYGAFRSGALRCYSEMYEFRRNFEVVLRELRAGNTRQSSTDR